MWQLEQQLEAQESQNSQTARSTRNVDRTVRDLQSQIERRDKQAQQFQADLDKSRDKIERLLQTIDELQAEDSKNQLAARRAERDLREEREMKLKLERELEGWKGLRVERGQLLAGGSEDGRRVSISGSVRRGVGEGGLNRQVSNSKGFL